MKNKKNLLGGLIIPAILLVLFLLNSFVLKEKTAGTKTSKANKAVAKVNSKKRALLNIVFQSTDGGQSWRDISKGLPEIDENVNFYAGESDLYLQVKNVTYRSKSNLHTPVWEKVNVPDPESASIAFNSSGVMAINRQGQIFQKMSDAETWLPIPADLKQQCTRTIFETSDETVLLGSDHGFYKSTDKGKNWKEVRNEGGVMNIVESEGVLVATGQKGIMRSTDNGENWQWVISEGGVGIAVERIEGGFAAISYNTEAKSRRIHISLDRGKSWQAIDNALPPSLSVSSIKQMGKYLIVGHSDGIFRSSDMGKTWKSVLPSVDKVDKREFKLVRTWNSEPAKVFRLHASGDVLYAVAGSAGC